MGTQNLREIEFCAIDLETTGINPAYSRIVEIGALRFNLEGEISRFQTLVNPEIHIPEKVRTIHGISDKMVAEAPRIDEILPDFRNFIENSTLVIQNPLFDLSFLEIVFMRNNLDRQILEALDTVKMAQGHFTNLPNHKLGTLAKALGLELQSHRALDDAIACMNVFLRILRDRNFTEDSTMQELLKYHGAPMRARVTAKGKGKAPFLSAKSMGKKITIKYVDSRGATTQRDIIPKELIRYGKKQYIFAHCMLRNEERCFMTDRIVEMKA